MFNKKLKREIADLRYYVETRMGRLEGAVGVTSPHCHLTVFPPKDTIRGRLNDLEYRIGTPKPAPVPTLGPTILERLDKLSKCKKAKGKQ